MSVKPAGITGADGMLRSCPGFAGYMAGLSFTTALLLSTLIGRGARRINTYFRRSLSYGKKYTDVNFGSGGGYAVWYLQVLDGAGYYAVSEVSAVAAEIEDYLLDGVNCAKELALPFRLDPKAVFAYKLGQKRVVVVFNHSAKTKKIRIGWKQPVRKPDTVEIVTGTNLADAKLMTAELKPRSYAVFVTLSQGN